MQLNAWKISAFGWDQKEYISKYPMQKSTYKMDSDSSLALINGCPNMRRLWADWLTITVVVFYVSDIQGNPDKVLSTKEWKTLPKEERADYIKSELTKDFVERVSYAMVWGETAKDKSKYLSDLHT